MVNVFLDRLGRQIADLDTVTVPKQVKPLNSNKTIHGAGCPGDLDTVTVPKQVKPLNSNKTIHGAGCPGSSYKNDCQQLSHNR